VAGDVDISAQIVVPDVAFIFSSAERMLWWVSLKCHPGVKCYNFTQLVLPPNTVGAGPKSLELLNLCCALVAFSGMMTSSVAVATPTGVTLQ
jgi:hypothetical protein